jgi:hypothetical protein
MLHPRGPPLSGHIIIFNFLCVATLCTTAVLLFFTLPCLFMRMQRQERERERQMRRQVDAALAQQRDAHREDMGATRRGVRPQSYPTKRPGPQTMPQ